MPTQQSTPGYAAQRSVTPRRVLAQAGKDREIRVGVLMDGTASNDEGQSAGYEKYIRGGCFLAYSAGKYAPVKRTKANGSGSATTALVVDNATHFRAGDSIVVGPNAAQVIVSVDSTTGITLTSAITWADNDPVYVSAWKTAVGVLLDDEVVLYNYDKSAFADQNAQMAIAGYLDQDKLLGDVTAILEDKDSSWNLRNFVIDDYQLGIDTEPVVFNPFGITRMTSLAANRTLTAAETGTCFVITAASTVTLPTLAAGLTYMFIVEADATLTVQGPSSPDNIIAMGDLAADSIAYSTSNQKAGAACIVFANPDLTKWHHLDLCKNTLTVA